MGQPSIFLTDKEAKCLLVEIGRRVYQKGYVVTNDGNFSVRTAPNEIWVTPAGVSKGYMTEDMMVKMKLDGQVLEGTQRPSSEVKMHLRVLQENPAVNAVLHAHPPLATAFAIAGVPLDQPIMVESVVQLGVVPIARYAPPGSDDVPESIAPFCRDYACVLLSNHGALTWGVDLLQAFHRLEVLENYAKTTLTLLQLGKMRRLSSEQMEEIRAIKETLGIVGGVLPKGVDVPENLDDIVPR